MNDIFIVPKNDGEALCIVDMLKSNGYKEGKDLFVTGQTWGASWENLETEIKDILKDNTKTIYGVELQGEAPAHAKNIDHHIYENDNRYSDKSSIEQVAEMIGHELSLGEKFVAENDKKYIPGMIDLKQSLMSENGETDPTKYDKLIQDVRLFDKTAQGITREQEMEAEKAIQNNLEQKDNLTIVTLDHSKTVTITDRLYGKYDNLLIISNCGEINFYGDGEICMDMQNELKKEFGDNFKSWVGGDLPENGFYGVSSGNKELTLNDMNQIKEMIIDKCQDLTINIEDIDIEK